MDLHELYPHLKYEELEEQIQFGDPETRDAARRELEKLMEGDDDDERTP